MFQRGVVAETKALAAAVRADPGFVSELAERQSTNLSIRRDTTVPVPRPLHSRPGIGNGGRTIERRGSMSYFGTR